MKDEKIYPQSIQDALIPVLWKTSPEHRKILENTLLATVTHYNGFDEFAKKTGVPLDELISCDWDKHLPSPACLKKIFPYMIPELGSSFDEYIEKRMREEALALYEKHGLDYTEDFKGAIENVINDFKGFSEREEVTEFIDFLCIVCELLSKE